LARKMVFNLIVQKTLPQSTTPAFSLLSRSDFRRMPWIESAEAKEIQKK